jgi:serine/threonine-protein kinase RsbW
LQQRARFGGQPLAVEVVDLPPYTVSEWTGEGSEEGRSIAAEAAAELLCRQGERLVLDVSQLRNVSEPVLAALARAISETHRSGREVALVRCPDGLYRRLQRAGVTGAVTHFASLLAATQGLASDSATTLDLHLRSTPEVLHRLRSVVDALAGQARLADSLELDLKMAVNEAAANAIVHGSPEGPRNHVRVSFYVRPEYVIVDVADQGPGFDPTYVAAPTAQEMKEGGYGLTMMRRLMDKLEFYRDDRGMLVRMTKYFGPATSAWVA